MHRLYTLLFVVALAMLGAPHQALAKYNPFELKPGKGKAILIVAIDDDGPKKSIRDSLIARDPSMLAKLEDPKDPASVMLASIAPQSLAFELALTWYDEAVKKPYVKLGWVASPSVANFSIVSDSKGRRYLVGPMGEGDAIFAAITVQGRWSLCFNAETRAFSFKADTYYFLGQFDPYPSAEAINRAVMTGVMPRSVSQYTSVAPLIDRKFAPFTPAAELPERIADVEAMVAENTGSAKTVQIPDLKITDYNLSRFAGAPTCYVRGSKSEPEAAKP
jgi:hypothetical protein